MTDGPVFVTGASGFIARHVVLGLLRRGLPVRGAVRSREKAAHLRDSLSAHLGESLGPEGLDLRLLDLMRGEGWGAALEGCGALIHTASPVPMVQPKDPAEVIRPAREGTLRVLQAAAGAGVSRVVLTSSVAAISASRPARREMHFTEDDWTDPEAPGLQPYPRSKTEAEMAAWRFAEAHPELRLTTINPGFVLGPALDDDYGTSLAIVERVLRGRDPLVPPISFSLVDVRDVAELHLRALEDDTVAGQRVVAYAGQMWLSQIANTLRAEFPDRRIARLPAPAWAVRLAALVNRPLRYVTPTLGCRTTYDNARGRALLGRDFIPPEEAVRAAGRFLVEGGHV